MNKILIFYGSYGGGHLSAARNIKEYIDNNYENCETMLVDCIEYVNKTINKVTTKAYKGMAKNARWAWKKLYNGSQKGPLAKVSSTTMKIMSKKLGKLIKEYQPNLIISTHFFSSEMCAILKKKGEIDCKIATVLTDYEPHEIWIKEHQYIDYYFVAHEGMKKGLIESGVVEEKINVTGIPLSNRFLFHYNKEKILKEYNLEENKKVVLFFAGGEFGLGKDRTFAILETLVKKFSNIQVVAIAGKNIKLKERFENLVKEQAAEKNVKVLEYTNKVPELMSISDLVITKPGGLTTTESLASGLPIIVINPLPGQEEGNARFVESKGAGIWIKKEDNVEEKLYSVLNEPGNLQKMKITARLTAKKNSTKDICEILLHNKN